MGRRPGGKLSPEERIRLAKDAARGRERQIRFLSGRFETSESIKRAVAENVGDYLARLHRVATSGEDDRVAVDAAKYLIDRVAGKPTERQEQVGEVPQPLHYSPEQFEELAKRVLRGGESPSVPIPSLDESVTRTPDKVN